jgi:hypothetical protein
MSRHYCDQCGSNIVEDEPVEMVPEDTDSYKSFCSEECRDRHYVTTRDDE